jgi:hypothetical protein
LKTGPLSDKLSVSLVLTHDIENTRSHILL